jgi:presequence protease
MMSRTPDVSLQAGQRLDGFEIKRAMAIDELQAVAYEITHEGSGARLYHLHTDDPENMFSINFPTPPPDDTGLPHILEHAVLAGSHKYPVREPFFEMVKMSMATFINAMTSNDCTVYPVASNVKQDLFNLAEVYFDATFCPLLTEETFKREGHHFAPADETNPAGDLTIKGIVYSEMKGARSAPEGRLGSLSTRALLPDTIYAKSSGGEPEAIPELTYEQFKQFHETYYHPSNAHFFLYGNIPTAEYLAFLSGKLDAFSRREIRVSPSRQTPWQEPRAVVESYPIAPHESLADKTYLKLNWLTGDATDVEDSLLLGILDLVLLGNEGAPLKKALIDSRLGANLVQSGSGGAGPMSSFSVGLKGSEPERVGAFVDLVTDTLTHIATHEIGRERVEAAFHQAAYGYMEIRPMHPIRLLWPLLGAWTNGADPVQFLRMSDNLDACRRRYDSDPGLFNTLIQERLLNNPHRLMFTLKPDGNMQARIDAEARERTGRVRSQLTDEEVEEIAAQAHELDERSTQPNPPEAVATLPQLGVNDLPEHPLHIPTCIARIGDTTVLRNDVFSNGVNYLALNFDLKGLPEELWVYLPHYWEAISKMGARGMGYEQLAQRRAACTGALWCRPEFLTHAEDGERSRWSLRFSMTTLDDRMGEALGLMHDLLFGVDPRDRDRLHNVLLQIRAQRRADMTHQGHHIVLLQACRGLTPEGHLYDTAYGLPQLTLAEHLADTFEESNDDLMVKIESIRVFLLARARVTTSFTGSDGPFSEACTALPDWLSRMDGEPVSDAPIGFVPFDKPPREGLAVPIQVAHCLQVFRAPHYSHPDMAALVVGAHLVSLNYMVPEVRFKGNAYGGWFRYDPFLHYFGLGSFRDPHITRTLEVFAGVTDYIRGADWTQTDIDRAIIATAKREMTPIRPGNATDLALHRHLTGQSPELREERYARFQAVTPEDAKRALLEHLEANRHRGAICVVSSREKLEEANREMPDQPLAIEDILS